jgi:hypothetical protein
MAEKSSRLVVRRENTSKALPGFTIFEPLKTAADESFGARLNPIE